MRTMQCIQDQASDAWGMGQAIPAQDLLTIDIVEHEVESLDARVDNAS